MARLARPFFVAQPDSVIEGAQPGARRNLLQARNLLRRHEFPPFVARRNEGKFFIELRPGGSQFGACLAFRSARSHGLEAGDFGIALEHFETHADFMQPIVDRLQFCGLVHHVFGRRQLAAVVQPGGDAQGLPRLLAHLEAGESPRIRCTGSLCEALRDFRHPCAMAAGIRALGIDGPGNQLDQCIEQPFLGVDQLLGLQGNGGRARQGMNEAQAVGVGFGVTQQDHRADQILRPVEQRHGNHMADRRPDDASGQTERGDICRLDRLRAGSARCQRGAQQHAGALVRAQRRLGQWQTLSVGAQGNGWAQAIVLAQIQYACHRIRGPQGFV